MLMVFLLIMPGVMSGLGNLLVPIQLCVPEMVFPKVNNLGTCGTSGMLSCYQVFHRYHALQYLMPGR